MHKHVAPLLAAAALVAYVAPLPAAAGPDRPFGGRCTTIVTPTSDPMVFPQTMDIAYDCTLRHLGRTTGSVTQVVDLISFVSPTVAFVSVVNATDYIAANGDRLEATFVGTGTIDVVAGTVLFNGTETYSGGTGRFADAAGSAALGGTASIFTLQGAFTLSGHLAY